MQLCDNLETQLTQTLSVRLFPSQQPTVRWRSRRSINDSYFDSLIIASALEVGSNWLYSEDLQNGQCIEDRLTVCNPFLS
ncbi:MAG: PIN domain-containing protein [Coleofasciculaceae cyanobacterium SM2_3_26]|nr:PIN domain-containing protein [Coleofasciculaceae cyanobacterium SM2_3_26]